MELDGGKSFANSLISAHKILGFLMAGWGAPTILWASLRAIAKPIPIDSEGGRQSLFPPSGSDTSTSFLSVKRYREGSKPIHQWVPYTQPLCSPSVYYRLCSPFRHRSSSLPVFPKRVCPGSTLELGRSWRELTTHF